MVSKIVKYGEKISWYGNMEIKNMVSKIVKIWKLKYFYDLKKLCIKSIFINIKLINSPTLRWCFQNLKYCYETAIWKPKLPKAVADRQRYRRLDIIIVMPSCHGTFL